MKKIRIYIPILLLGLFLGSCLKYGLEELPAYDKAEITKFTFEHRIWDNEENHVEIVKIASKCTIDTINNIIDCELNVRDSHKEKYGIELDSLVGMAEISIAAKLKPVGTAPVLGIPGDYSQENIQYEVTAADGKTIKIWTLHVEGF